jgi:hypothetical protein
MSRLAILTSILEPLLINDMNLDKAIEARLMDLLLSLLYVPEEIKIVAKTGYEEDQEAMRRKLPVYLKYALRCITSCVRSPVGVMDFYKNATSVMQVIDFLEYVRDEEILANSAKVIRIVLRDDKIFENLVNKHMELGNILVGSLQKYSFSEVVIIELLAALRNFTRVPAKVPLIAKTHLGTLVSLAV